MWIKKRVKKVAKAYQAMTSSKVHFNMSLSKVEFLFDDGYGLAIHKAMWRA